MRLFLRDFNVPHDISAPTTDDTNIIQHNADFGKDKSLINEKGPVF